MTAITKITAFYYLAYPDSPPDDPLDAGSETYVELGDAESTVERFIKTVSVFVCTPGYLASRLGSSLEQSVFMQSIVLVPRFDSDVIRAALERHLQNLASDAQEV